MPANPGTPCAPRCAASRNSSRRASTGTRLTSSARSRVCCRLPDVGYHHVARQQQHSPPAERPQRHQLQHGRAHRNPPFMSSDTRHEELPEAAALADDERVRHQRRRTLDHLHRHSRINRHEDPPLGSPTAAPSISSSSGLSSGAAAGIGVGVALGVIILAAAGFLGWRRRRRGASRAKHSLIDGVDEHPNRKTAQTPGSQSPYYDAKTNDQAHEVMHTPAPQEVPGQIHFVLDAMLDATLTVGQSC
ncbi:hypothetical protein J3459_002602 [Metarhizium acridum]|nr:hypothetical protein J3459_002602 [Metarhizium acridum]